jgi:hypothetical protein
VWALNDPRDKAYIDGIVKTYLNGGAIVYYVELHADLRIRLKRNKGRTRLEQKPSKRDLATSEAMLLRNDKEYELNTSEQRPFFHRDNYLKIDNTNLAAIKVAAIIREKFSL